MPKPVLPTKRRRKGFESVRKDYRSADARPMFFEKQLFYSKLTGASGIRKGLLHVSFGAVRSRCRCALKNAFLYRIALHELKKLFFSANQKFSFYRKLYKLHSKPFFTHKKLLLHVPFFAVRKNFPFLQTKSLSFAQTFTNCPQKPPFLRAKSLSFAQTFSYSYPKQPFSTLRLPFQRPLTYCLQRIQPFFCSSL